MTNLGREKMRIKSVINNNVVLVNTNDEDECVLVGRGIGFSKKPGEFVEEDRIQKKFLLADKGTMAKFSRILNEVTSEELLVTSKIISMARQELKVKLNESIYISLTDHIHYVIERYHQGKLMTNTFLWDIKRYYPKEFEVALKAVHLINKEFNIKLKDDEAGYIAFHFINATNDIGEDGNTALLTKLVHEIINIVSLNLDMVIDSSDISSYRFITHVKFFSQRLIKRMQSADETESDLFNLVRNKYEKSYKIVKKIDLFLNKEYQYSMSKNDQLYFMMHIHRLIAHEKLNK